MKKETKIANDEFFCSACNEKLKYNAKKCPKCNTKLRWTELTRFLGIAPRPKQISNLKGDNYHEDW